MYGERDYAASLPILPVAHLVHLKNGSRCAQVRHIISGTDSFFFFPFFIPNHVMTGEGTGRGGATGQRGNGAVIYEVP